MTNMTGLIILQLGIPRSGSTFVWQVLSHILGAENVVKAHPGDSESWHLRNLLKVVTVRHPCDVVGSLWAIREPADQRTIEDLENVLAYAALQFTALRDWMIEGDLVLRYEDHVLSPSHDWLDTILPDVSQADKEAALRYASLESNKARAETMSSFEEHDPITHIHGKHIGALQPESWRDIVPLEWHDQVIEAMKPFCVEWNYKE